jgi:carbon storage regulator
MIVIQARIGRKPQRARIHEDSEEGMLVLSRRTSQQIMIGPEIEITIVRIDRSQVRVGIEAPPELTILRKELAHTPPRPSRRPGGQNTPPGGGAASSPETSSRPA